MNSLHFIDVDRVLEYITCHIIIQIRDLLLILSSDARASDPSDSRARVRLTSKQRFHTKGAQYSSRIVVCTTVLLNTTQTIVKLCVRVLTI